MRWAVGAPRPDIVPERIRTWMHAAAGPAKTWALAIAACTAVFWRTTGTDLVVPRVTESVDPDAWAEASRQRMPDALALVVQHFPLGLRPASIHAAVAVECADRAGRYEQVSVLLGHRGLPRDDGDWRGLASDGGVADVEAFSMCLGLPADSFPRIADGKKLGERAGVFGTPTVWVNGRPFGGRTVADFERFLEGEGGRDRPPPDGQGGM